MPQSSVEIFKEVTAEARERNAKRGAMEPRLYDFEIFDSYCALCEEIAAAPLPVLVPNAAAYLLMRGAQGAPDHQLSVEMRVLTNFHQLCNAQVRPFGDIHMQAIREFGRALSFAQTKLANTGISAFDMWLVSRKKAFEMFPDGKVPKSAADVAA